MNATVKNSEITEQEMEEALFSIDTMTDEDINLITKALTSTYSKKTAKVLLYKIIFLQRLNNKLEEIMSSANKAK
jgi:hypothetical protein